MNNSLWLQKSNLTDDYWRSSQKSQTIPICFTLDKLIDVVFVVNGDVVLMVVMLFSVTLVLFSVAVVLFSLTLVLFHCGGVVF